MPRPGTRLCDYIYPDGHQCGNSAKAGLNRCRFHGGNVRRGVSHPNFRNGKYSKYMPDHLMERYEQAREDKELLSLREDIAVVEARLTELMQRTSTGETDRLWERASTIAGQIHEAQIAGSVPDVLQGLSTLMEIIKSGVQVSQAWNEVLILIDQKRRLVESERKRLVEMQQMISSEEAVSLMALLVTTVRNHVSDPTVLQAIGDEFLRLTQMGGRIGSND